MILCPGLPFIIPPQNSVAELLPLKIKGHGNQRDSPARISGLEKVCLGEREPPPPGCRESLTTGLVFKGKERVCMALPSKKSLYLLHTTSKLTCNQKAKCQRTGSMREGIL